MAIQLINDSKNTTLKKPSFYAARDSAFYLLLDSDTLENKVDLIHKMVGGILGFFIRGTHKGLLTVMARV